MKKCIIAAMEEEKLLALRMYAEQKGVSIEEELTREAEGLFQKYVPGSVKAFLELKRAYLQPSRNNTGSASIER